MHPSFYAGLIASFLPAGMRPKLLRDNVEDMRLPAIISGIVQLLFCVIVLIWRYPAFVHAQQDAMSTDKQLRAMEIGGEASLMGLGVIFLIAYILRPLSLLLIYFAFEGVVRFSATLITGEPVGTLPLYLFMIGRQKAEEELEEHRLGELIPDTVEVITAGEDGVELRVASCRPKDWNPAITISYEDKLYELAKSIEGPPPRRFMYLLRPAPGSKLVRGLRQYDPNEVLTMEEAQR